MIITCNSCSASLQIADEKIPKHSFSLRCPKCQSIINNPMPAGPALQNSLSGGRGSTPRESFSAAYNPAPAFMPQGVPLAQPPDTQESPDVLRQLLELLQGRSSEDSPRLRTEARRVLLCVTAPRRTTLAKMMVENGYQVYLAENCRQAVERMKAEHMHVLLLDLDFAAEEDGFRFMMQELQRMRPAQRRRMIVVKLAPDARTYDHHAAFLQSVNLLINAAELNTLPEALERTLRYHNELYRDFYEALNVAAV
jgi:predicted Zn finger-like uncharacterized protein